MSRLRWALVVVAACALVAVGFLAGWVTRQGFAARSVRAQGFVLVDSSGKERARLALWSNLPALVLKDEAGKVRFGMGLDPRGNPSFSLLDAQGMERCRMALSSGDRPALVMRDKEGDTRAELWLSRDGKPEFALFDENGTDRAHLGGTDLYSAPGKAEERHESWLVFYDRNRKVLWAAP